MVKLPASSPLDSLVDLACRDGVEIRPTLLRVVTDLYVQKPSHSPEEEAQYVELALGLIDAVDPLTRGTVTATLSAYPGAPELVLRKLASLPLASRRGETQGDELIELFFDANTDERRLILTNLDVTADAASLRPMPAASELIRRLERAARERNSGEFARVLERALGREPRSRDAHHARPVRRAAGGGRQGARHERRHAAADFVVSQPGDRAIGRAGVRALGFIRRPQRGGRAPHARPSGAPPPRSGMW